MNFKEFIKVNRPQFALYIILAALVPILAVLNTYMVQIEADIILTRNLQNFLLITLVTLLISFASYATNAYAIYFNRLQEQELNNQVRAKIVQHYYLDGKNHAVSEMQNRLTNDLQLINDNYYESIFQLVYGSLLIAGVVVYLILLNWLLLVTILIMLGISLALPKLTEKPLQKATEYISDSNQRYLDSLNDWLSGLAQIRQFVAGAKLFKIGEQASKKLEDANVKQTAYVQLLKALNGIVSAVMGLVLFIIAGYLTKDGKISVGVLLIVGNFRYYLSSGIDMITTARGQMKGTTKLIAKVDQSAQAIDVAPAADKEVPAAFATENLSLAFPNGEKLTYPDLQVKAGEKILLSGDSGAGKSTLFKLILGELKPSTGKIVFENNAGQQVNPDLAKIGYIPQDPVVFPASISDNITMFNQQLAPQVPQVVSEVNFSADIAKFKQGLNEELNLDKLNISGGQRQKIVLARAKVHDSEIILIDEGTSAIDQKATMAILQNLVKTKATIVFIAHNFNEEMRQLFDREIHLVKA